MVDLKVVWNQGEERGLEMMVRDEEEWKRAVKLLEARGWKDKISLNCREIHGHDEIHDPDEIFLSQEEQRKMAKLGFF